MSQDGQHDCDCCVGISVDTPALIDNRPGLSAIAYRVGHYSSFRQSLQARLSDRRWPALRNLRTREDQDFTIALLDAWAVTGDILTFYQERIVNESYLRTATERRSLLELARLIGYELKPGLAARTVLSFTLDTTPGAPTRTTIAVGTRVQSIPGQNETPQTYETSDQLEARAEWNALTAQLSEERLPQFGDTYLYLEGVATNLKPGDAILLVGQELNRDLHREEWDFRRLTAITVDAEAKRTKIEWADGLGTNSPRVLPAAHAKVYAFRTVAGLFGFNAPHPSTLSDETLEHYKQNAEKDWEFSIQNQTILLDRIYPAILRDSWVVLSKPSYQELYRAASVGEAAEAKFTLAGKTTRIQLEPKEHLSWFAGHDYRDTLVFAQSEELKLAQRPLLDPITGARVPLADVPSDIQVGQFLAASGTDPVTKAPIREVVTVSAIVGNVVTVTPPLAHRYERASFAFNANVVPATHGETVKEVLGSGDGTLVFQKFHLKQPPLTYVTAETPSGSSSTLRVYVNDILWHEVPFLYGHGPTERIYVTRRDDDGRTTVQFGDGITGARLPTGQHNVRVEYRKGTGLEGLVQSGQLSLLPVRPLGVKSVLNPEASQGAEDPEHRDAARRNAPRTVLTLDRAVSLQDYEDLARSFAGIAKAQAVWVWDGRRRNIFLTVAGPNEAMLASDGKEVVALTNALRDYGDPFVTVTVRSYRRARFDLHGTVTIHPDHLIDPVMAAVKADLQQRYSFDAREFGQPVALSEVIAAMQAIVGVVAVDVDRFARSGGLKPKREARLIADRPAMGADGVVAAAELLLLDPTLLAHLKGVHES
jgi:predicted phage baseplate assembly protein